MLYVQHLLGIGHLKRASILAQAMSKAGLAVSVVLGGPSVANIDFPGCARILLPSASAADARFSGLLDEGGRPIDEAWRDRRQARLCSEFAALRPDVLVIEQFPFGRRQFRFELMPLLEAARAARPQPWIVCSIRDALVRKSSDREREMVAIAAGWFDRILVHADPTIMRLEETLPEIGAVAGKLVYTGYVADAHAARLRPDDHVSGRDEVIVSVGGGVVGEPLLRAALATRPLTSLSGHVWRLICGPNLPPDIVADLRWRKGSGVIVDRWRADLPVLLRNCVLSISQAGYNTLISILQARARAVVVPFATGNETEQAHRARTFGKRGLVTVVELEAFPADKLPEKLAEAVESALAAARPCAAVDLSGAESSAEILLGLTAEPAGSAEGPEG